MLSCCALSLSLDHRQREKVKQVTQAIWYRNKSLIKDDTILIRVKLDMLVREGLCCLFTLVRQKKGAEPRGTAWAF